MGLGPEPVRELPDDGGGVTAVARVGPVRAPAGGQCEPDSHEERRTRMEGVHVRDQGRGARRDLDIELGPRFTREDEQAGDDETAEEPCRDATVPGNPRRSQSSSQS